MFWEKEKKNMKMNILTPILSSKYFFQIRGSQTFPCQGPPNLATDTHLEINCSRDPQKQRFQLQRFPLKKYAQKFEQMFMIIWIPYSKSRHVFCGSIPLADKAPLCAALMWSKLATERNVREASLGKPEGQNLNL